MGRCGAFGIWGRLVLQEVLSVRSVSKAYPGATALQDVSLSIRPGEIRGLCGENGAGKSTLVNILMKANQQVQIVAVEDAKWQTDLSERIAGQLFARYAAQGGLDVIYGMPDHQSLAGSTGGFRRLHHMRN